VIFRAAEADREQVDDLIDRFAAGGSVADLAVEFERHVRRLTAGIEPAPRPLRVTSSVEAALQDFLIASRC
jgi:hypothetical protein